MKQEYEIQLRDGKISDTSFEVIRTLSEDYQVLQFEEQIDKIVNDEASKYLGGHRLLQLLQPVRDGLVKEMFSSLNKIELQYKKSQRLKNNQMCREKCTNGSEITNFTKCEIPEDLNIFLKNGLKDVPELALEKTIIITEVEKELKLACNL